MTKLAASPITASPFPLASAGQIPPSYLRAEPAQRSGDEPRRFLASGSFALLGSAPPLRKKPVVVCVRTNPVPHDFVFGSDSHCTIATHNARGPDWLRRVYLLEVQRWVMRVLLEEPVCTAGLAFDI